MKFNLSINISQGVSDNFNYIVTPNAQKVYGNIVDSFQSGIHSFLIIGTYGTGKSSFLMALEQDLLNKKSKLVSERSVFADAKSFEFMNIVGDYSSLSTLLSKELSIAPSDDSKNVFSTLTRYLIKLKDQNKFLFIFIDEFGKILEHAANNNPEKELYFLQTLAEFVNVSSRNVILITTLHQNFGSYAHKLTETQRNEWLKVKGRFKELVFAEPVEQLLFLAAESLTKSKTMTDNAKENFLEIFSLAKKNKIISESLTVRTSKMLYPLDAVAASCLTLAIQRYGQNERTLFSFLHDTASNSINSFLPNDTTTYNLAVVYDYVIYNFYTALAETNLDSTNWRAIRVAIERVESGVINKNNIDDALKIVKSIGLLNLFYNGVVVDLAFLETYALKALGIKNPRGIIEKLTANKIIRFAAYKSQFILFEGTDINIEDELYKAATIVPVPKLVAAEIAPYVKKTVVVASASYYRTGTPRYFQYVVSNEPYDVSQFNDIKGWYEQKERASVRLSQLEDELENNISKMDELKEQMNNLNPANSQVKILKKVHKVLEEINKAFFRAQKDNLRRFLTELEKRANEYLDKLSANDFHGTVRLVQTANDSTEIHLYSSNGTEITNPSGSQKTVMYISVLFAISDFTQEKRDEDYPLFFDAATSSFGDSKESDFYNVIDKIDKQCIIVTKDFITRGKVREEDINKLTCSVYRIKKVDGFDQTNMATIRTIINKIK